MKITTGAILGTCYGICVTAGLAFGCNMVWWETLLVGVGCGGFGAMLGGIWDDMLNRL